MSGSKTQQRKEKKIKKLRKGHIWPSIVFFGFSAILTMIASVLFMALIIAYFAGDRLDAVHSSAEYVCRMLAEGQPEELDRIMDYLEQEASLSDAVYVLDDKGEIIAGFGGATYNNAEGGGGLLNLGMWADIPVNQNIFVYNDREENYGVISAHGDFETDAIIERYLNERESLDLSSLMQIGRGPKKLLYRVPFWMGMEMPGQRMAMVKCTIDFYESDFALAALIAGLSCLVMFLPLVFLFINLLHNVSSQRRMTKLLYTDTVTSGNNWFYFEHYADKVLSSAKNAGKLYALADVTLMKYRGYCTCHGVKAGEALLERIDRYLGTCVKGAESCAHYDRASFALLLRAADRESCEQRVKTLLEQFSETFEHGGMVFHAGIYFEEPQIKEGRKKASRRKNVDVAEAYNHAGAARASLTDENQMGVAVFDNKLLEEQLWEHRVEEKMHRALENEEFQVYLQPKYNPVTEQLAGAEALVRWISAEDGFISPGRFIPIFEKNGFITKLDDYMISHVAKLQAEWLKEGKQVVPISVNVSRAHFANPDLAQHICGLVDAYQVPHHLVEIELTESAFFDDKEALLNTVRKLKELGFDVSMDDFGAGYSSLNSLKDLPLDVLKLDAEFFRGEDGEERGEIVVSQAIDLAKKLNMRIVAEGVEKKNQVEFLAAHECDMIQGFYFAKPMPAGEYEERLQ